MRLDRELTRMNTNRWPAKHAKGRPNGACLSRLFGCFAGRDQQAAFTLAEVLAALAFMAIVIPAAVEGLRVANLAGQIGQRKAVAARIAERVLNERLAAGQSRAPANTGTITEGVLDYRWSVRTEPWNQDTMRVVTVVVTYQAQGREYDVRVSTLVDNSMP
jgi:type II secretory pathway pseudopilin PulG